jgi:hypothetical protein
MHSDRGSHPLEKEKENPNKFWLSLDCERDVSFQKLHGLDVSSHRDLACCMLNLIGNIVS